MAESAADNEPLEKRKEGNTQDEEELSDDEPADRPVPVGMI